MRVLPVQSHASASSPAPAAAAQPGSASPATAAVSFKQVLDKSSKAKQTNPDQPAATAAKSKKTNANSAGTSDATDQTEESGQATAAQSQAATGKAPALAGKTATGAKPKAGDAVKSDSESDEDAESQPVKVDAEQTAAVGDEQSSSPDDEKEAAAGKSRQKSTVTDTSSVAAVALVSDDYLPQAVQALAAKTDGESAENAAAKPAKSNVAGNEPKGTKLKAEETVQPANGKSPDPSKGSSGDAADDVLASVDSAAAGEVAAAAGATAAPKTAEHSASPGDFAAVQQQAADAVALKAAVVTKTAIPQPPALSTDAQIAAANNRQIVTAVHTQLLPNGGSMQIRLDPPELGALQITVQMRNGVMTAEFAASSDQAANLLSHSLGDLKSQLETQGVSVEKLHVTQAPRSTSGGKSDSGDGSRRDGNPTEDQRREQQRREMIRRMWSKLAGEPVPLDMVA